MAASTFFVPATFDGTGPDTVGQKMTLTQRVLYSYPEDFASWPDEAAAEPNTFIWDSTTEEWVPVIGGGGGTGTTDHGALTGLADDDHPQYVHDTGDTMTGMLYVETPTPPGRGIPVQDTGWRGGLSLINGWNASSAHIRRMGNLCTLRISSLNASGMTSVNFFNLPTGFTSDTVSVIGVVTSSTTTASGAFTRMVTSGSGTTVLTVPQAASNDPNLSGYIHWYTAQAWPASYPGTPV